MEQATLQDDDPTNTNPNPNTITTTNTSHSNFQGTILQDFLASPPLSPRRAAATTHVPEPPFSDIDSTFFGSLSLPPPATPLSLNYGPDCHQFLEHGTAHHMRPNPQLHGTSPFGSALSHAFVDSLGSPSIFPSFCKKRPQENEDKPGDRRHKRMIKNRESAARSRARKRAYTNELELEVARLMEENAKLRKRPERFLAACDQPPKKHTLCRSLTAPF